MDRRWQQLGELLVHYSAAVKPGERVLIALGEMESLPLAEAVYTAAVKAGAYPQVLYLSETLRHSLLRHGNREQVAWLQARLSSPARPTLPRRPSAPGWCRRVI